MSHTDKTDPAWVQDLTEWHVTHTADKPCSLPPKPKNRDEYETARMSWGQCRWYPEKAKYPRPPQGSYERTYQKERAERHKGVRPRRGRIREFDEALPLSYDEMMSELAEFGDDYGTVRIGTHQRRYEDEDYWQTVDDEFYQNMIDRQDEPKYSNPGSYDDPFFDPYYADPYYEDRYYGYYDLPAPCNVAGNSDTLYLREVK